MRRATIIVLLIPFNYTQSILAGDFVVCTEQELTRLDSDINFVIMDYLINEGYPAAAQKFAVEAGIAFAGDQEGIQQRVDIRNAIHAGDMQQAIERINELNPEVSRAPAFQFSRRCKDYSCFMHHS